MRIRPAEPRDLPCLAMLTARHAASQRPLAPHMPFAPRVDWHAFVAHRLSLPNVHMLVAEEGSTLAGFLDGHIVAPAPPPRSCLPRALVRRLLRRRQPPPAPALVLPRRYGYLENVYVEPAYRRRGLARELACAMLDWLAAQGVYEVELAVWSANEPSLALCRELGFTPVRLLMRRALSDPPATEA